MPAAMIFPNGLEHADDRALNRAFEFNLPEEGGWDFGYWRNLIKERNYSPKAMVLLPYVLELEKNLFYQLPTIETLNDLNIDAKNFYRTHIRSQVRCGNKPSAEQWQRLIDIFPLDYKCFAERKFNLIKHKGKNKTLQKSRILCNMYKSAI